MASEERDDFEGPSDVIDISGEKPQRLRISQQDLPPSPPLTRSNSVASSTPEDGGKEAEVQEHSWDPLQHDQETQLEEDEEFVASTGEAMYEAGDSAVDINDQESYARSKPSRSNLRLEIEHKVPSPQPWDLVDPPPTNGEKLPNPYGTITSHRTLQDSVQTRRRNRSLIPKSSYYFGPPPPGSAYGSDPVGQIGLHHPREIIRVERDYTGGELIQFAPIYPLELEGRITPTQFLESMNSINELLISAHSFRRAMVDNWLAIFTLQISTVLWSTHYEREMKRLQQLFDALNTELYNPSGLNLLWPQKVAFLFLEIEYYVSLL
ncbi:hypothetical protein GYMLUDRAFT_267200 [Collybiopsis luxurians FD-317 M1]|nr:hypothetical protein GYMLUDRAFT_267200 [Collybiopsis luxurians FD-317 M1]